MHAATTAARGPASRRAAPPPSITLPWKLQLHHMLCGSGSGSGSGEAKKLAGERRAASGERRRRRRHRAAAASGRGGERRRRAAAAAARVRRRSREAARRRRTHDRLRCLHLSHAPWLLVGYSPTRTEAGVFGSPSRLRPPGHPARPYVAGHGSETGRAVAGRCLCAYAHPTATVFHVVSVIMATAVTAVLCAACALR